jgi:ribonuclease D
MTKNNSDFYITKQTELDHVIALIKKAKIVALDTEFTRQTTYYPILSIIQVAVKNKLKGKESFIIDCLCDLDLKGFFEVIADPEIIKILHSPMQDLQIFYHKSGKIPHGIIDTQIMANFCGFGFNSGYSGLVERFFDQHLNKDQQRSDWQIRPLSPKQIEYALLDVAFLEEIYEKFYEILIAKNRLDWCFEEMRLFIQKILENSETNLSKNFFLKNKTAKKTQKQIYQIKNLITWRESWAKKIDIPRQHFLKDDSIIKIVFEGNFKGIKDKTPNQKMIEEIKEILDEEGSFLNYLDHEEKLFFMSSKQKNRYKTAKNLIGKIAAQENLREQFLVTSSDLKKMIHEEKFFHQKLTGWRYNLFGKELEEIIFDKKI